MEKATLKLVLIGEDKRTTGSALLNKRIFKTAPFWHSTESDMTDFHEYNLFIVNIPALEDTVVEKAVAMENIDEALKLCDGEVNAFLLVLKFGNRLINNEKSFLGNFIQFFGTAFLNHVIAVVTGKELFELTMKGEKSDISFHDWCRQQTGAFRQFYEDCGGRFVLFNNKEKDEELKRSQRQDIVQFAFDIKKNTGCFTKQCLNNTESRSENGTSGMLSLKLDHDPSRILSTRTKKPLPAPKKPRDPGMLITRQPIGNSEKVQKKGSIKLNFLLIGKTGEGKSSTGNFLLQRFPEPYFGVSSDTTSETSDVDFNFSEFDEHTLLVVDGPGLADTRMSKVEDIETASANMAKALAMCYGGVDTFLLVIKFGSKFTSENKLAVEALKHIFGPTFMDHVIIVFTGGDLFQNEIEDRRINMSFHEWCKSQVGAFPELYDECQGRCVLLNKREKDNEKRREKIGEIIELTLTLRNKYGRYTNKFFQDADKERQTMIRRLEADELALEVQEKLSLLVFDIQNLPEQPSTNDIDKIKKRTKNLLDEIKDKGAGPELNYLRETVAEVELNLDDNMKLQELAMQLESIRRSKEKWKIIAKWVPIISWPFAGLWFGIAYLKETNTEQKIRDLKNQVEKAILKLKTKLSFSQASPNRLQEG